MPSRRRFLTGCAALGLTSTLPTASAATGSTPTADLDAALDAFGSGHVAGRFSADAVGAVSDALPVAAAAAPDVTDRAADRLPVAVGGTSFATREGDLGTLETADLYAAAADPTALDGVAALAVGVDFTARGPVLRARVTGTDGTPSRAEALDALAAAGLPAVDAADPLSVPDGDDLALTAGFDARDDGQPAVLALVVVVLAAVVGTFLLGIGSGSAGGGRETRAPQVAFAFEYDGDTGRVTVTHEGGDSVAAGELMLAYESDGTRIEERWRDDDGTVQAGDSVTTRRAVDSGNRLRVVWDSPDGSASAVLGAFEAP
jgi:hypothetical protein